MKSFLAFLLLTGLLSVTFNRVCRSGVACPHIALPDRAAPALVFVVCLSLGRAAAGEEQAASEVARSACSAHLLRKLFAAPTGPVAPAGGRPLLRVAARYFLYPPVICPGSPDHAQPEHHVRIPPPESL